MSDSLSFKSAGSQWVVLCPLLVMHACLFSSVAWSSEEEFTYNERMLPAARTYEMLHLCASHALEFENDKTTADHYIELTSDLQEAIRAKGWDGDALPAALVVVFEEKKSMEVREDDTRESFSYRHYSGAPCDRAVKRAQIFLDDGVPEPAPDPDSR